MQMLEPTVQYSSFICGCKTFATLNIQNIQICERLLYLKYCSWIYVMINARLQYFIFTIINYLI